MASSVRFSLERASALSRPPERAGRVPCDPKAAPRIRVSTIRPSQDLRPLERATFVSSCFFHLRSRSSLIRCMRNSEFTEPRRRLRADGLLLRWSCSGRRRRCWFLTRSSLVAVLLAAMASLMPTASPPLPPLHPVGSGGRAGAAAGAASCASASNGSSADDSVKPNAAPSPSRESAFRREIISILISCFISGLPVMHECRTRLTAS